ncbi:MAG: pilin [Candidatus Peregrinibacteria bacterium]|nr:pilin [Candidatus Peregrinibacteria bacterium]
MTTLARLSQIKDLTSSVATSAFLSATTAFAAFGGPTPDLPGTAKPSDDPNSVRTIITTLITTILNFLALLAVIYIIVAGIRLIISQGEEGEKDKAKKTILYVVIGLIVILFARVIVGFVTKYIAGQVD